MSLLDFPWHVEEQLNELRWLYLEDKIGYEAFLFERNRIEQKYMAAEHRGYTKASHARLSHKSSVERDNALRRKGLRFMSGPNNKFQLWGATWDEYPNRQDCVFLPYSCANLSEFVDRGKILFGHDRKRQIAAPLRAIQDPRGLGIEGEWLDNRLGRDMRTIVRERIAAGKRCDASIGISDCQGEYKFLCGSPVHLISEFALNEISFVRQGAHPALCSFRYSLAFSTGEPSMPTATATKTKAPKKPAKRFPRDRG